jgi:hypothetical protein
MKTSAIAGVRKAQDLCASDPWTLRDIKFFLFKKAAEFSGGAGEFAATG